MLELPKLLVIILALVAFWFIRRWFNEQRRDVARRRAAPRPQPAIEAEDLVPCAACGAYVAAHGPACGRRDCPQPG